MLIKLCCQGLLQEIFTEVNHVNTCFLNDQHMDTWIHERIYYDFPDDASAST